MLWESPTAGNAIELRYLPGGAQVVVIVRLSEVSANTEGERVMRSLGDRFNQSYLAWQQAAGVDPNDVETVAIGFYGNDGQAPRVAIAVKLLKQRTAREIIAGWGEVEAEPVGLTAIFKRDDWTYLLPSGRYARYFIMGHRTEIRELAESGLSPSPLRRDWSRLAATADGSRHVNVLFSPKFLWGDGQALLSDLRPGQRDQFEAILGDEMRAGLASVHFGDDLLFAELRAVLDPSADRTAFASEFRRRLGELPDSVERRLATTQLPVYGGSVALRFPAMLRFMNRQLRSGLDGSLPTVNAALPAVAAHNLTFATSLLFAERGSLEDRDRPAHRAPQTIQAALSARLSIRFDQESLEAALASVAQEFVAAHGPLPFAFKITILGEDLEQEGITRNQQIRAVDLEDATLAEILTAIVQKANPNPTPTPADPNQRVLWVVGPDPSDAEHDAILISTRSAAEPRFTIPAVFKTE